MSHDLFNKIIKTETQFVMNQPSVCCNAFAIFKVERHLIRSRRHLQCGAPISGHEFNNSIN